MARSAASFTAPGTVRVWINRVEEKKAAKDGESRPGESEIRIELDRFSVIARGLLIGFVTILLVLDRQSAQVSVVSRGVLRRLIGHSLLLGAGELGVELVGDGTGDFAFHTEDVIEFTIVAFGPEMFVGGSTNELHVDVHRIGNFLHTALE